MGKLRGSNTVFGIVSETNGGKDTAAKYLKEFYDLDALCSYSTRPMRVGEKEGREHKFITPERMHEILATKNIAAYTKIEDKNSGVEGYEYCATIDDVIDADTYIIDPMGIRFLREKFPDLTVITIYIYAPLEVREHRAKLRQDDMGKFKARVANEQSQFDEFRELKQYDDIVYNGLNDVDELRRELDSIMNKYGINKIK